MSAGDGVHALVGTQQQHIGAAQSEQAICHYAHDIVQLRFQFHRLADFHVVNVQNDIAVIGNETVTVHRIAAQLHDFPRHVAAGHGNHFHRQRELPQHRDFLGSIGDADEFLRHRRDDFFPRQRAAAALDQAQVGIGLVGAIHINGNVIHGIQVEHGNAVLLQALAGGFGTGHRAFDPVLHLCQVVDEVIGSGTSAHPHDGAFFHIGDGGLGDSLFQFVLSHVRSSG